MNVCTTCGAARERDARFCTGCGTPFPDEVQRRQRRNLLIVFAALGGLAFFGCLLVCTALILILEVPDPVALALSIIAAVVPAVVYSMLVLYLDRNEKEPWYFQLAAFFWGAVVAVVFSYVFNSLTGLAVTAAYGASAGEFVGSVIAAPLFEEFFKGSALVILLILFRSHFDNVLDGIVYGALVGLGFAMTENIIYFGRAYFDAGVIGLGFLFVLRAVLGGFGHALYTATFGASLGWARSRYGVGKARFLVPAAGLALAMLQHALWNGTAWGVSQFTSDGNELLALAIIILVEPVLFILPGLVAIVIVAVITSRRELIIIRHELREEVELGIITPAEYAQISDGRIRRQASFDALRKGGPALWILHRRFIRTAAQLAFQKYHVSQGEIGQRGLRYRAPDGLRAKLARTRAEIARRRDIRRESG
jgi:RsiW-degrading membrane proteinase PrsW (M82 family)